MGRPAYGRLVIVPVEKLMAAPSDRVPGGCVASSAPGFVGASQAFDAMSRARSSPSRERFPAATGTIGPTAQRKGIRMQPLFVVATDVAKAKALLAAAGLVGQMAVAAEPEAVAEQVAQVAQLGLH